MSAPDAETREIEALERELAAVRAREAELRELLAVAHEQLAHRDEELVQAALGPSQLAQQRVAEMQATRVWRAATVWWRTRDRVRGLLRAPGRR